MSAEAALNYLEFMTEELNRRQGADTYENMHPVGKALYWAPAGLDQFASGVNQLFSKKALPTSPVQYTSALVREEAHNINPALGFAYDLGTSASNMAPSILASTAVGMLNPTAGAVVGNTLMGLSAGGNAYNQKMKEGYSPDQARSYATLVGASEALLQYFLGGIGKLGGVDQTKLLGKIAQIDNALARFALTVGAHGLSEGVEEGLQELLEPAFASIIFGDDYEVDPGDVVYSALLGATMGGVFALPDIIGTDAQKTTSTGEAEVARLVPFSEQERANLSSGSRNRIISGFSNLVKFVRNALSDGTNIDRAYMGKLPDSVVSIVKEQTGIDISGFSAMMNGNDVRHIIKDHGDPAKEAVRGQVPVTAEDIAMIEQILATPDQVKLSPHKDTKGRMVLEFSKEINGRYITLQAISVGKHLLQTDTMYIKKKKNSQDTGHNVANDDPVINAQSVPPQSSSINNILQIIQQVKTEAGAGLQTPEGVPEKLLGQFRPLLEKRTVEAERAALAKLLGRPDAAQDPTLAQFLDDQLAAAKEYVRLQTLDLSPEVQEHYRSVLEQGKEAAQWIVTHVQQNQQYAGATESKKEEFTGDPKGGIIKKEPLTQTEEQAILSYKSSESYKLNEVLRDGGVLDQQQQQMVEELDRALPKLPIYQGPVYRRMSFDLEGEAALQAFLTEHQTGALVEYPAYISASSAVDGYPIAGELTVTMVIQSAGGRNLDGYGNNFEQEIVFLRESRFFVERVEIDADGKPIIYMREVTENGIG